MKRNLLIPASNEPSGCLQTFGDCREGQQPCCFAMGLLTCMVICLMGMLFLTGCEKKPEKAADGRKKITLGAIYVSDRKIRNIRLKLKIILKMLMQIQ